MAQRQLFNFLKETEAKKAPEMTEAEIAETAQLAKGLEKLATPLATLDLDNNDNIGAPAVVSNILLPYLEDNENEPVGTPHVEEALASASPAYYTLFQPRLTERLLSHVINGEKNLAERILRNNPRLSLEKGIVTDYSGRTIEGTVLQLALGAEDVNFYLFNIKLVKAGMAEMIMGYLKKLPAGESKITEQINEQFPEGWEKREEERHQQDMKELFKIRQAIANSPSDEACESALQQFRNYLDPKEGEVTRTGKHWNARLLLAAFELGYRGRGRFDTRQNNLFHNKVIGYIQRFAPANDAQLLAQGSDYLFTDDKRSLNFRGDSRSYFPLSAASGLGYENWRGNSGIESYAVMHIEGSPFGEDSSAEMNSLQSCIRAKTASLQRVMQYSDNYRKIGCIAM